MSDWQPMETAPKDRVIWGSSYTGMYLMLWDADSGWLLMEYALNGNSVRYARDEYGYKIRAYPTDWQPTPYVLEGENSNVIRFTPKSC